jgi:hypothetical protein
MMEDVDLDEALRLIDDCERRGVPILGMEWFYRGSDTVTPAGIADFSGAPAESSWDEARRLLAGGIPDGANTIEVATG